MTLQIKKLTTSEVIEDKCKECMGGGSGEGSSGNLQRRINWGFYSSLNENRNDHNIFLPEALTFIPYHPICFHMDSYTIVFLSF